MNSRPVIVAADDFSIRAGHADGAVWGKSVSLAYIRYVYLYISCHYDIDHG